MFLIDDVVSLYDDHRFHLILTIASVQFLNRRNAQSSIQAGQSQSDFKRVLFG